MKETGQSILEITIAMGIAVIVLSALTIITLSGIKNSQFSQNQLTASNLAQSSIDQIRAMRDQNSAVCYNGSISDWNSLFGNPGSCNPSGQVCKFEIQTQGICSVPQCSPTGYPFLCNQSSPQPISGNASFSRLVTITDDLNGTKKINVVISWSDSGGTHSVNLATDLGPTQ